MKVKEYKTKSRKELEQIKKDLKLNLMIAKSKWSMEKASARAAGENVKGNSIQKNLRREIARINLALWEKGKIINV